MTIKVSNMKNIKSTAVLVVTLALSVWVLVSCHNTPTEKAQGGNMINWEGVYSNVIPCADCEGIQLTIVLNKDMTCRMITKYLSKNEAIYDHEGTFSWDKTVNKITLAGAEFNECPTQYIVSENKLTQLDMQGDTLEASIVSQYALEKVSDILEKPWKLIELDGQKVITSGKSEEACFILKIDNYRVNGNGGCNSFTGNYILSNGKKIKFSSFTSTMKSCRNMEIESKFFKTMEIADNYSISQDSLFLNTATKTHIAKFILMDQP
jgi:heat shock protein HslJ